MMKIKSNKDLFKAVFNISLVLFFVFSLGRESIAQGKMKGGNEIYAKDNLIAWCIVPFDSKRRGPEERAEMLNRLGINKLAYDWREEHISTFDKELETLKENDIKLQGFWFYSGPDPANDKNLDIVLDLFKRHNVKTQLWCMFGSIPDLDQMTQAEKVKAMSEPVVYVAKKLEEIGCSLGLYKIG